MVGEETSGGIIQSVSLGIDSVFDLLSNVTEMLRSTLSSIAPGYETLIILGVSMVGAYYFWQRMPEIRGYALLMIYGLVLFLVLKFV